LNTLTNKQFNPHYKTALITGASGGIGAAIANQLAAQGLHVILAARRVDKLSTLAREFTTRGCHVLVMPADLSTPAGCEQLVRKLAQKNIQVDVLVNNAGFGWYGYFSQMPWQTALDMLSVNVSAVMHLTRLLLPAMLARRQGHIINIGSIAGGLPNQGIAMYSATKAFLDAFTTALYRELRGSGVQVSVVRPGPVKTPFFRNSVDQPGGKAIPGERLAVTPQVVSAAVSRLLVHPRRVLYVPRYMVFSPLLERLFHPLIDHVGPILLRRQQKAADRSQS